MRKSTGLLALLALLSPVAVHAAEYHVAISGNDENSGNQTGPFRTIQHAADIAQPGDVITVHGGVYRERIDPPRGGTSDSQRITYQAAKGEKVVITGSELLKNWVKVTNDTWKATLPNSYFGAFNPYKDRITGDWFSGPGIRHTGCVYLDGIALSEASSLKETLKPAERKPLWYGMVDGHVEKLPEYLINLSKLELAGKTIPAREFSHKQGAGLFDVSDEGGKCVGYIKDGTSLGYNNLDFGSGTQEINLRLTTAGCSGGLLELHLDSINGPLVGTYESDLQDNAWRTVPVKIQPVSGIHALYLVFRGHPTVSLPAKNSTDIYAQFPGVDPNKAEVEINVRQTVFTPRKTGIDYITVKGFDLRNAATPWAPPTAGQMGLITAYWCKGWVIENNTVTYSVCSGICLGKYSDGFDNASSRYGADPTIDRYYADGTRAYQHTIDRAMSHSWNKDTIGSHLVQNNTISFCGQAGIVGSLGAIFSTIQDNVIHDIDYERQLDGCEMAGIKFHGAIDVSIIHNHIYRCIQGLWMDWMGQGLRISRNFLHDNVSELSFEVVHGPYLVDNNVMISGLASPGSAVSVPSSGGAYVHNLIINNVGVAGGLSYDKRPDARATPFFKNHDTVLAGRVAAIGNDRMINNLIGLRMGGFSRDDNSRRTAMIEGNVYFLGARAPGLEQNPCNVSDFNPNIAIEQKDGAWYLRMAIAKKWATDVKRRLVTTDLLGKTIISDGAFENSDGSPIRFSTDYFGKERDLDNPYPGPFAQPADGDQMFKVW